MGEEKKDESKKDEGKKEEEPQELVLKVDMHCEACARKVARALRGFEGVEEVTADYKASKVVVKGKADPVKVCQRIQKKSGRKVEIISPLPKPPPQQNKPQENKEEPKQDKKEESPAVVTIVLRVAMHCEACAQGLEKKIRKVKGVESVTTDVTNDRVTVKGVLDPDKLVTDIYKKTGKQALVVKDEEKKEEKTDEEKKEEKQDEKKQGEEKKEDDDTTIDVKRFEYLPPRYYYMEQVYAPTMFSDDNPNACSVM